MPADIKHKCTKVKEFNKIALNNQGMAKDIEAIKESQTRIEKSFTEMKDQNKEFGEKRDKKLDDFIEEIRKGYTTIKEHEEVKTQLDKLKDKLWSINFYIVIAVIAAVLAFTFKK